MLKLIVKLLCLLAVVAMAGCATVSGEKAKSTNCYVPEPEWGYVR